MVSVEVDDEDPLESVVVDGVLGGDGDVVAQTEAVELRRHRVVPGRTNQREAVGQISCKKIKSVNFICSTGPSPIKLV